MAYADEALINKLAGYSEAINGVKKGYGFAQNPDNLTPSMLPCIMFYPQRFTHEPLAHHNRWMTVTTIRGALFVAPRESSGGRLKFLENAAIPFGDLFRKKFEDSAVITDLLSIGTGGTTQAWLTSGMYGAGMPELIHNDVPYIGWIFEWTFKNTT